MSALELAGGGLVTNLWRRPRCDMTESEFKGMRLERERHRIWHVALCGECGAQQDGSATESHFSGAHPCPNAGKIWARKYVEVVPKEHWEEACQHLEALLDADRDVTPDSKRIRDAATLYLSKFETIGVPASTATDAKGSPDV